MKELNRILDDLYEIEHNQESLEFVLTLVEESFAFSEHKEIRFLINFSKLYIKAVNRDLLELIERMDEALSK